MKTCKTCHKYLPLSDYYTNNNNKNCKPCSNTIRIKQHRTKNGIISLRFSDQNRKPASHPKWNNGWGKPNYTLTQLKEWALAQIAFHSIHSSWVVSNFDKKLAPSFDRIDSSKPYTLTNLQITTWEQNRLNYQIERVQI